MSVNKGFPLGEHLLLKGSEVNEINLDLREILCREFCL